MSKLQQAFGRKDFMVRRLRSVAIATAVGLLTLAAGTLPASAAQASDPGSAVIAASGNFFQIRNTTTDKCLEMQGVNSVDPGGFVQQWSCTGNQNQYWAPEDIGGGFVHFVNQRSGLCLDIKTGGPVPNGTRLQQWSCNTGISSESWQIQVVNPFAGTYQIVTAVNGLCIDLKDLSSADGATIQMWTCIQRASQIWRFV
jgi:hypothetical protein